MVGITQEKQFTNFVFIVVPLKKQNLGTTRIKTDAKSLEEMKTNLRWGYLKILT